ncbi:MAG: amidohydrolase family protein [Steroidobacteraceae bacterium]
MKTAEILARSVGIVTSAVSVWMLTAGGVWAADLVITNARVFTGTDAPEIKRANIAVSGERIEALSADAIPTTGAVVIDAHGMTVMPGLIDAHMHTFFDLPPLGDTSHARPKFPQSEAEARAYIHGKMSEKFAALLDGGFTSVLSPIDLWPLIIEVRQRLANGELKGPRLFVAGGAFTAPQPQRFCGGNAWCNSSLSVQASSPEQARDWVRRYADSGVDLIVAVYDPTVKPTPLTPEVLRAVIDEAHHRNLRVFLESPINAADVPDLVDWGIDGFLHSPRKVMDRDGTLFASAGRKHLPLEINLGVDEETQRLAPQVSPEDIEKYKITRFNTLALLKAGATPVWGSDLGDKGLTPAEMISIEARSLKGLGLTPKQILQSVTRNAAHSVLGREDLGTLEPGKTADVIMVDGDPLKNPEALAKVVLVIKGGKVVADHRNR